MPVAVAIESASNADNFGFLTMPFAADCLGYYLFGGNQAASVKNLIPGGADLNAGVGTGGAVYSANAVDLKQGSYFRTPYTVPGKSWTVIAVRGVAVYERCYEATDATYRFPPIYGPAEMSDVTGARALALVDGSGNNTAFQSMVGASVMLRDGTGGADLNGSGYLLPAYTMGFTDGAIKSFPHLMIASVGAATTYQITQAGRAMVAGSLANTGTAPGGYVEIGNRTANEATAHYSANGLAVFGRQLSQAEALLAGAKMCADLQAHGLDQFSAFYPDLAAA